MTERPEKSHDSENKKEYILSQEEKKALERLREFAKRVRETPPEKRIPISNPDKYDFPIGMDDEGNLKLAKDKKKKKDGQ